MSENSNRVDERQHVVIVGGGFGGLEVARRLRRAKGFRVTLIDRNNYHLFQPLLYQVATGALSPANIATPLRAIVSKYKNCTVLMETVTGFDTVNQRVIIGSETLQYDTLVVAAGATHSYFGRDDWERFAPGLKTIEDATEIRKRIYLAFEAAEREDSPEQRTKLMTFVVVGGGPTGLEMVGSIAELARHTLRYDFRKIQPADARIVLVESAEHVIEHFSKSSSLSAEKELADMQVEVLCGTKVIDIQSDHVLTSTRQVDSEGKLLSETVEGRIDTRTVVWAAGVQANSLGKAVADACGVEIGRSGRVPVRDDLTVGDTDNVFVIGDLAQFVDSDGKHLPGVAPVAMQQGRHVANLLQRRSIRRGSAASDQDIFAYKDPGTMATIGRAAAVAEVGTWKFTGLFAWMMWLVVHLMQLVQFQNRVLVLLQWAWHYSTFNRSARIIVGDRNDHHPHTGDSGAVSSD